MFFLHSRTAESNIFSQNFLKMGIFIGSIAIAGSAFKCILRMCFRLFFPRSVPLIFFILLYTYSLVCFYSFFLIISSSFDFFIFQFLRHLFSSSFLRFLILLSGNLICCLFFISLFHRNFFLSLYLRSFHWLYIFFVVPFHPSPFSSFLLPLCISPLFVPLPVSPSAANLPPFPLSRRSSSDPPPKSVSSPLNLSRVWVSLYPL